MRRILRLHADALADALRNLAAQPVASLLSILVLAFAIALPVIAAVILESAAATGAGLDTEPHMSVFLVPDATADDAKRVEQALRSQPDVAAVRFIPRAEALRELQSRTHLSELLAALDQNPLPDAFTVRMRSADGARLEALKASWSRLPKVDQVAADFEWAERLARWARAGERLLIAVAIVLAVGVAFIVAHLIRLQVLTRREEIEVSQLIGATATDVRRPFLYHGALQGLLASGVALLLAAGFAAWTGAQLSALTPEYASELKLVFPGPMERAALVAGASLLGLLGAGVAVSRQLRRYTRHR